MISYHQVLQHSLSEISQLDISQLKALRDEASDIYLKAKASRECLDAALDQKYKAKAKTLRSNQGKDSGVVQFQDRNITIVTDLPKKIQWDQSYLKNMAAKIADNGEDPSEFIDISYKVPERKYSAWPDFLKKQFEPARTLKFGKPTYQLKEVK